MRNESGTTKLVSLISFLISHFSFLSAEGSPSQDQPTANHQQQANGRQLQLEEAGSLARHAGSWHPYHGLCVRASELCGELFDDAAAEVVSHHQYVLVHHIV